jgi:hypothetical protein
MTAPWSSVEWLEHLEAAVEADHVVQPFVYFLGCDGMVKIGTALDVERRVSDLTRARLYGAVGSTTLTPRHIDLGRARLIGSMAGGRRTESFLHRRYNEYRSVGEWFYLTDDLVCDLEQLLGWERTTFLDPKWPVTSADVIRRLTGRRPYVAAVAS